MVRVFMIYFPAYGVPVEMFIYPDMAHPITKPRENRAVIQQNLDWFRHYLLDEAREPVDGAWGTVEPRPGPPT